MQTIEEIIKTICRVFDVQPEEVKSPIHGKKPKPGHDQDIRDAHKVIFHMIPNFSKVKAAELEKYFGYSRIYVIECRNACKELMSLSPDFRDKYYAIQDKCYMEGWL